MKILAVTSNPRLTGMLKFALPALTVASLLALTSNAPAAVIREGPSYRPTGANYQIFAAQGIDPSTPLGKTGFNPQVNRNFEINPSIGVTYDKGNGLTDFGLGLYKNAAGVTQSTGLNIQFDSSVIASSVIFTVADFDISQNATFFNPNKVEPGVLIFGPGNTLLANVSPTDIFSALMPSTAGNDIWNINLGQLLENVNLSRDTAVSGFLLFADMLDGEKANSDPYLLLSVGSGMSVVPEPATYLGGLGLIGLLLAAHAKAVLKRNRA